MKDPQALYNFFFTTLFVLLICVALLLLHSKGEMPSSIELFDFVLISLASFRLIRLFTYDKAMLWFRDFFVDIERVSMGGETRIIRGEPKGGIKKTLYDLSVCSWCFGAWIALFVSFFYFYTSLSWFPILFLAVAGLATMFQLLTNLIGWHAEAKKRECERGQ